ncbi:MAG: hypothetical protein JWL84_1325 [Rhodospirillales bacterium]|jgi:hypothetical protein|nr:hypothetical protein [Rhodospirillales bacterium]
MWLMLVVGGLFGAGVCAGYATRAYISRRRTNR